MSIFECRFANENVSYMKRFFNEGGLAKISDARGTLETQVSPNAVPLLLCHPL